MHFELITEVVNDDGRRVRLDGAVYVPTQCPLCGRRLVEDDGKIRATIAVVGGSIRMICQRPAGCQ